MAARTLAQIVAELNPTFQPQVKSLQQQQALLPGEIKSQESALNAKKDVAYEDIVSGARRRGLGFSGIPLGEQAKYAATDYAPALASLRQQGQQRAMSLQDAILAINERRDTLGQQIYQTEQDRAFQAREAALARQAAERQAAAARAASASTFSPSFSQPAAPKAAAARVVQSKPGSFTFYDASNKPITAAQYAARTNTNIGDVLYDMANAGDKSSKFIYNTLKSAPDQLEYQRRLGALKRQFSHILGGA